MSSSNPLRASIADFCRQYPDRAYVGATDDVCGVHKRGVVTDFDSIRNAFIRAVSDSEIVQTVPSIPFASLFHSKLDLMPKLVIQGKDKDGRLDRNFPMCPDFQVAAVLQIAQETGVDRSGMKIYTTNPGLDIKFDFYTVIAAFKKPEDAQKMIDWARAERNQAMRNQAINQNSMQVNHG